MGGVQISSNMAKCTIFCLFLDIAGVLKDAPSQKYHICVYHVVFDWKMVLVLVGGVQISSDMSNCVAFCVFLDIAEVSNDSLSQKYQNVCIPSCVIGKWYWCWWVELKCPAIWPFLQILILCVVCVDLVYQQYI